MAIVKVVTGYIDIPNHPRGAYDYRVLGEKLLAAIDGYEALVFDGPEQTVADTWMAQALKGMPNITRSVADNPEKNTLPYHCCLRPKCLIPKTPPRCMSGSITGLCMCPASIKT